MKKSSFPLWIMVAGCIAILFLGWQPVAQQIASSRGVYSLTVKVGDYTLQGPPTITAAFIDQVLTQVGSPATGTGQALYSMGVKSGIDPVYALAFFKHESTFGTIGEATVTRSLGNERCIADRPCIDQKRGGYAVMQSWVDGYDHWYSLMLYGYVQGKINKDVGRSVCPCTTVEQIIPVYAPNSDGNNEQEYIASVEQDVIALRAGQVPR